MNNLAGYNFGSLKVLVVDDHQPMRRVIRDILREFGVREVEEANDFAIQEKRGTDIWAYPVIFGADNPILVTTCVGDNECLAAFYHVMEILCVGNREAQRLDPFLQPSFDVATMASDAGYTVLN